MKKQVINMAVNIGGVKLRNPILLASGTCGYGLELQGYLDFKKIGGFVAKSVTLNPREGNPMPRVVECASGMLNAIGLANVGIEVFCQDKVPAMKALDCAVIANIAGSSDKEYISVTRQLDQTTGLDGLELNVSCPNVHAGGIEFGRDPKVLGKLVRAIRKQTKKPLWIKLSPNVTDIIPMAKAAEAEGADALTVMNTLIGMRIDINKRKPVLANLTGGLSGPAIKPVALNLVYKVSQAVTIPVIGCGGIETADDAIEFILAGASAVQIGTGTFRDPKTAELVGKGMEHYLKQAKINSIKKLIGAAQR